MVVADFDGDGFEDIFASNEAQPSMYHNTGASLDDLSASAFAGMDVDMSTGGSAADFDGDGDLDLFITRYLQPNLLLRNDGGGNFTDVTATAGVAGPADGTIGRSLSSAWADFDGDDDLDLYVGSYGFIDTTASNGESAHLPPAEDDLLYLNDGDGTFTDRSDLIPPGAQPGYTYVASWIDLNGDLKPDMYLVNDFGVSFPNQLLWNDGGTFRLDPGDKEDGGVGLNGEWTGMGIDVADLNHDDLPDLLMPIWRSVKVLQSSAGLPWLEAEGVYGAHVDGVDQRVPWGGEFGDIDNDGDVDMAVQLGHVTVGEGEFWENPLREPDAVFVNDGGTMTDNAPDLGMDDDGIGRGGILADFNNDGFLDLAKRDLLGSNIAYVSNCDAHTWLRIRPHRDWGMNRFAIGAKITVVSEGEDCPGDQAVQTDCRRTEWIQAGGTSLASSKPPEAHFGLGTDTTVSRIEVTWPDGRVSVFTDVATNQILDITQDAPAP
jgi:hypothetical protein